MDSFGSETAQTIEHVFAYHGTMSENVSIQRCPPEHRPTALRELHAGLPPEQQLGLVQALKSTRDQDDSAFDGLIVALADERIAGATWCQLAPGSTAVIWLPNFTSPAAVPLLEAAVDFLDERRIVLAQLLANADDSIPAELLAAADLRKLARLAYLSVENTMFPATEPKSRLQFESHASEDARRLGDLLLLTYQGSLDCPQLNGVRTSADILDGYRQQGAFSADRWFFVRHDGQDAGALILAAHPETANCELVYMGLVPAARGQRLGREVLEFAMWKAGTDHAERLVLAVDEANKPALDTYLQAGFQPWDHRTVFARLRQRD